MAETETTQENQHFNRQSTLLIHEIKNYGASVEGRGVIHRWVVAGTGETYRDILAATDKQFSFDTEDEAMHLHATIDQAGDIEYAGTISIQQAIGEITLRREALEYQAAEAMEAQPTQVRATETVVIKGDIL
jgi:hypothetical protein